MWSRQGSKTGVRLAVASILAAAAANASAADTAATNTATGAAAVDASSPQEQEALQEVVVTSSYLKSLATARNIKKESNIEKDVIVAEDMAKFPELNLAESIQRMPGVAITRDAGEGREISLRGLGPDFSRVQLNGMEVIADNDSAQDSVGQRTRDRSFDFNLFASELFQRVEIEKTYEASQNEGGMAGTVGLFTAKPLDNKEGWSGAINTKAGSNTYTDDFQSRVAALVAYNWDNKLGAEFSVAWSRRKTQEQGYNDYQSDNYSLSDIESLVSAGKLNISQSALQTLQTAAANGATGFDFSEGNRLSVWDGEQKRLGTTMALQYRPADNLLFTVDGLHGEYDTVRDEYHLATRPFNAGGSVAFDEGTIGGAGSSWGPNVINTTSTIQSIGLNTTTQGSTTTPFVSSIGVDNATFGIEHTRALNMERFNSLELTGQWEATDALTVDGHVGAQTATYHTPYQDKLYMRAQGDFTANYAADGDSASNTYGWNTTNASNYLMDDFYFRGFWNDNTEREAVLNLKYQLAQGYDLRAGYSYHRFWNGGENFYDDGGVNGTNDPANVPGGADKSLYPYTTYTRGAPVGAYTYTYCENKSACWLEGNFAQAFTSLGIQFQPTSYYRNQAVDVEQNFDVEENTNDGYLQFDWDQQLFGKRFRGNIGARFYHTSTRSTGWQQGSSYAYEGTVTKGETYSGVLPALNAVLEFTPEVLVRFAATQNTNPPSLDSIKALSIFQGQQDDGRYAYSAANPNLKPYKDTTLDLSFEWYFGKMGLVSAGIFHKSIKDWIISYNLQGVPLSATGLTLSPSLLALGLNESSLIDLNYSVNDSYGVNISGAEFATQTQFTFLPAPFDKLGVLGNFTYIHGDPIITGLSKINANATLFYETDRYGVRVSLAHRSEYLISPFISGNPDQGEGFQGSNYVDAAAFYKLPHNIEITFDAINLTNEKETEFYSVWRRLYNQTQSGTTYLMGASWKF